MPRTGGIFTLVPSYFAESGQTITVSSQNPVLEDIGQALTDSLPRDGSAPMNADLPMGGNDITNVGAITAVSLTVTGSFAVTGDIDLADGSAITVPDSGGTAQDLIYSAAGVVTVGNDALGDQTLAGSWLAPEAPTQANHIANKAYVDEFLPLSGGDMDVMSGIGVAGGDNALYWESATSLSLGHPNYTTQNARGDWNFTGAVQKSGVDLVTSSRSVTAGAGLSGGGDLSQDRTISHPTSGVTDVSGTGGQAIQGMTFDDYGHAVARNVVDFDNRYTTTAALEAAGGIGSLAMLTSSVNTLPNETRSSGLVYSNAGGDAGANAPGTWRCLGYASGNGADGKTTLWIRIS